MTALLALVTLCAHGAFDAESYGLSVDPTAYSASVPACISAPAGLVRLESWELGLVGWGHEKWLEEGVGTDLSVGAFAGGPLGGIFAGGGVYHGRMADTADTTLATLCAGRVLTGDPVAFLEGFFGPSVSLGVRAGLRHIREGNLSFTGLEAAGNLQIAMFPTFCAGVGVDGTGLAGSGGPEFGPSSEVEFNYAFSYVFNRDLRGHLSGTEGDVRVGADLRLGPGVSVRTGSDWDSWSAGARFSISRVNVDYGIRLTEQKAGHMISVGYRTGEWTW